MCPVRDDGLSPCERTVASVPAFLQPSVPACFGTDDTKDDKQDGSKGRPDAALSTSTRRDLALVLLATVLSFLCAAALELHEAISRWTTRWEVWEIDEVPSAITVLALGLAWFAFRRRAEAAAALRLKGRAEARALQLLDHNRELARQLIAVQENERLALARELHDELGQRCNAIRVEAAYIHKATDPQQVRAAASRAAASAEALYQHVRNLLRQLRPAELDELGLVAALQALCESWEERSGVACIFRHEGSVDAVDDTTATALYRVAQEALSNVMRHAQASRVRLHLQRAGAGELQLEVQDDGCGFHVQQRSRGLGLLGAAERAAALGGELMVHSEPGMGTRLRMNAPAPSAAIEAAEPGHADASARGAAPRTQPMPRAHAPFAR